ncbi:MAG: type I methionyl aminopeptidase [Elusimicrobiota bacterium]
MFRPVSVDLKSAKELSLMREAGAALAEVMGALIARVAPGVSTGELDSLAEAELRARKAKPAFLGYRGFPAALCASVNQEVVHGIPRAGRMLQEGDLVSLDIGCFLRGFYSDTATTVPVGRVSREAGLLLEITREALYKGIEQMRSDRRVGDISAAIQGYVERSGFSVVREFVGHGIGRALHEDPPVPNFGKAGTGVRLRPGMVLALEPMVNAGAPEVRVLGDQWTAVTCDGRLSAHFEHTVAVTEGDPEVLTAGRSD